eukprot:9356467-Ditylum_brightwellii.AAC.1
MCNINIHIDNKGIVKRINDQLTYTHNYPFKTLELDRGVVAQVADTLKQYKDLIIITHVKCHQDDTTLLEELTLPARLNAATDFLATNYSLQHGISCLEVPRLAITCVQLCTKNGVISSHYYNKVSWILQQKKTLEIISKRSDHGQIKYLKVLIGQLINAVKTYYIIVTPKS